MQLRQQYPCCFGYFKRHIFQN